MFVPARKLNPEELEIATSVLTALKSRKYILTNQEGYKYDLERLQACHHETCCGYEIIQEPLPSIEEEVLSFLERGYKLVKI